jgi:hypothetical protein
MKKRIFIVSILLLLICISAVNAASTSTSTTSSTSSQSTSTVSASVTSAQDAASQVYISGYDLDPEVFYSGESGTVTIHVTNGATSTVTVSQPDLMDPNIEVVNKGSFTSATSIGPGATVDYNFVIRVNGEDGTYFPLFTVSTNAYGGQAIHSLIKLKIDSTDVRASIAKKPDTFSLEKIGTVNVSVVNPRLGDVSDVLIVASGTGSDISPSESYVGTIPAGGSVQVPFDITPHQQSDVTFNISFRNGDNHHSVSVTQTLNIGEDKAAAVPIINNVALVSNSGSYTMTGDVTNAGVTDATGMILMPGSPATPVEPYSSYAVGSLTSNDFSSFTLTFTASDLSAVPVIVQWKDAAGNSFKTTTTLDLRSLAAGTGTGSRSGSGGSSGATSSATGGASAQAGGAGAARGGGGLFSFGGGRGGGLSAFYPLIAGALVIIIAIVLWIKRKWIVAKFRKQ